MAKTYRLSGGRKAFNQVMKGLIGLGVPTGNVYLLTVSGRRTGRPRSTPVSLLVENGHRWLIAPYGEVAWVQNVRTAGRAQLKNRGRAEEVQLSELPSPEAAPLLKQYRDKYAIVSSFFDAKAGDPVERFGAEASKHPVFAIGPISG